MMKVAIPVWQERVSPVFDAAGSLLVVEVEDGAEKARSLESIKEPYLPRRSNRLLELGVNTLICGAISRPLMALVSGLGIRVIPFIGGGVEEVLEAFLSNRMPDVEFLMPGCRGRKGFRKGRRSGRGCEGR